ncbi:MAG: hypothetical protein A2741_00810 [Candidatus Zambryskibacteria bacterium RIFCSPHIGHO2_01_FULL_43_27]|uniref:Uncharacterized protein n=1 Tax=Candidatus Zambryskibacteria bacterium RIFCSPLOWO2_01_FULL_43_17 TaxID=1802760 RepID=A0A1G2U506_9BACT|nr:MAG: hypothetical protein A2741_00810 [Candidatus Zambryskibacteria bacterium RIFCSPHIGHO2_01_FULL_43_27]OHB00472.1 MAG: hypothetical protein A3E93_01570 [Candidatus Zambryskibacteria bacterium RIFCSPHIGHO2_12_FULL_43_12b]OHB04578.1 MAG: hypothetical protein A2920_01390 [Candidatus Zambryskibacteria bacterium RIFCSPLOWO2_01_FULL_43_17]
MFNLLPEIEKKNIMREYILRRYVVLALFLFALGAIASISLFPSYLLSSVKVVEVEEQISSVKSSAIFKEAEALASALNLTNQKISALKPPEKYVYLGTLVSSIVEKRGGSIRLNGFKYNRGDGKNHGVITVSGIARDRESLSAFLTVLKEEEKFLEVNLPVSNFAQDRNAPFTIDIRGAF